MKFMGSKRWMLENGLGSLLCQRAETANRFVDLFAGSSAVTIKYDGSTQTTSPVSPSTNGSGSFSVVSFTVPASVQGSHTVAATDASANSASTSYTVAPKITLSPSSGNVGELFVPQ